MTAEKNDRPVDMKRCFSTQRRKGRRGADETSGLIGAPLRAFAARWEGDAGAIQPIVQKLETPHLPPKSSTVKTSAPLCVSALMLAAFLVTWSALSAAAQETVAIENEHLTVRWQSASSTFSIASRSADRTFVTNAAFAERGGSAKRTSFTHPTFGAGDAIEVSRSNGNRDEILLVPKLPFALLRSTLANRGSEVNVVKAANPLSATLDLGKPASQLKTLGTGGLLAVDKNPGSYVWLAVAEPESRNGVVVGWLTHERGSGVLFSERDKDAARITAQIDYGKLRIHPGKSETLETLAIGYFDDARIGLEQWADAAARVHNVKLKEQPTGYCTWYSQPHGGAADEKRIVELAAFSVTNLAPFGFTVVQIDDKWQAGWKRSDPSSPKKNFTTHDPKGPYPGGMKATADRIKALGLTPGIWFMPFAGTAGDPFFDQHLDWFAKTSDGKPYDTPWGGTCLDLTHPGAREHVRSVVSRICREWGYEYIKIDGLWTGTATKQLYVNSGYKEDDIGDAVFRDPEKTNIETYRSGLKLVREAAGPDVFILGCNAPQNMRSYGGSFGLVDAMRIGPDNKADWKSLLRGPTFGTRHYFLHGRMWLNDPDPVYVRTNIPLKHAQLICTWVALSGQLNLSSEWLPGLPPERLEVLKRTMPSHHATARPIDLFEKELPSLWLVESGKCHVAGIFNWNDSDETFGLTPGRLGLKSAEYIAFDFWGNRLVPMTDRKWQIKVAAQSCVALAVRPKANHPQLMSTSRHVTQGLVDVTGEKWDAATKTLSGRSKVVGKDPYELRIVSHGAKVEKISLSAPGVNASHESQESLTRVRFTSPTSREVTWRIQFK